VDAILQSWRVTPSIGRDVNEARNLEAKAEAEASGPRSMTHSDTVAVFKPRLKTHLFHAAYH